MSLRGRMRIEKDGVLVGVADDINFIQGANVTLTVDVDEASREASVTIASSGGGGGGGGHTIKESGTPLTDRAGLNFGSGFDLSDDAGNDETDVALDLSEVAGGGDITWTGNTPAVDNDSHDHTSTTVTTHSTAHAHSDLSGVGANDHHNRSHDHSNASDSTTLSPATLNLPAAASPAQTADGQAVWDSDDNLLTIGDGASRQTFIPVIDATSDPVAVHSSTAADGTEASTARKDHQHAHGTHTSDLHTNYVQESLHASESFDAGHHAQAHDHSGAEGTVVTNGIANNAVTYAKMQDVSASDRLLGRDTAGSGDPEELTVGGGVEFTGSGGIQRSALTGDVTASAGSNATTIANDAVSYAKMQNVSAASRLLGRGSAGGAGDVEEITLGSGLTLTGTSLSASGGSGSVATDAIWDAKGDLAIGTGSDTAARLAIGTNFRDRLTPDSSQSTGVLWVPHAVRQTADVTVNNSTTLVNLTGLSWSIGTGSEVWFFQAFLRVTAANAAGDIKVGWATMPTGATMAWGALASSNGVQQGFTGVSTTTTPTALSNATATMSFGGSSDAGVSLSGFVYGSTTSGTIQLMGAQHTADATDTVFKEHSLLLLWRLV